jgi:hypothetical protein
MSGMFDDLAVSAAAMKSYRHSMFCVPLPILVLHLLVPNPSWMTCPSWRQKFSGTLAREAVLYK